MRKTGNIFIVSAPSGCGKTTIVEKLLENFKGVKRSISTTTRMARKGEKHDRDYHFTAEKTFKKMAERGEFLEWAHTFGYYYGTPGKNVEASIKAGQDVILTIDVKGAMQIRKKIPEAVLVFIMPPSIEELARRLRYRKTDKTKEIAARLAIAKKEIKQAKKYDYIIINKHVHEAVEQLKAIITAKRCEAN